MRDAAENLTNSPKDLRPLTRVALETGTATLSEFLGSGPFTPIAGEQDDWFPPITHRRRWTFTESMRSPQSLPFGLSFSRLLMTASPLISRTSPR